MKSVWLQYFFLFKIKKRIRADHDPALNITIKQEPNKSFIQHKKNKNFLLNIFFYSFSLKDRLSSNLFCFFLSVAIAYPSNSLKNKKGFSKTILIIQRHSRVFPKKNVDFKKQFFFFKISKVDQLEQLILKIDFKKGLAQPINKKNTFKFKKELICVANLDLLNRLSPCQIIEYYYLIKKVLQLSAVSLTMPTRQWTNCFLKLLKKNNKNVLFFQKLVKKCSNYKSKNLNSRKFVSLAFRNRPATPKIIESIFFSNTFFLKSFSLKKYNCAGSRTVTFKESQLDYLNRVFGIMLKWGCEQTAMSFSTPFSKLLVKGAKAYESRVIQSKLFFYVSFVKILSKNRLLSNRNQIFIYFFSYFSIYFITLLIKGNLNFLKINFFLSTSQKIVPFLNSQISRFVYFLYCFNVLHSKQQISLFLSGAAAKKKYFNFKKGSNQFAQTLITFFKKKLVLSGYENQFLETDKAKWFGQKLTFSLKSKHLNIKQIKINKSFYKTFKRFINSLVLKSFERLPFEAANKEVGSFQKAQLFKEILSQTIAFSRPLDSSLNRRLRLKVGAQAFCFNKVQSISTIKLSLFIRESLNFLNNLLFKFLFYWAKDLHQNNKNFWIFNKYWLFIQPFPYFYANSYTIDQKYNSFSKRFLNHETVCAANKPQNRILSSQNSVKKQNGFLSPSPLVGQLRANKKSIKSSIAKVKVGKVFNLDQEKSIMNQISHCAINQTLKKTNLNTYYLKKYKLKFFSIKNNLEKKLYLIRCAKRLFSLKMFKNPFLNKKFLLINKTNFNKALKKNYINFYLLNEGFFF